MNITIRRAEIKDCPRILELIRELALYERAPQEVTVTLPEMEQAGFGKNPVWNGLVAIADGIIVGMAIYYVRYSTWKGCRMYLEDILVTESYRGKGIGKLLFDELMQECKRKNFAGMVWQVLDWNEPAINFYKKYNASFDGEWLNSALSKEQIDQYTG